MKQSIFVLLLICGFGFYNCKGQTEESNEKNRNFNFEFRLPKTPKVQQPTIISTPIQSDKKSITLRYINGDYYLRRQKREIRIVEDSIAYRHYLGLTEGDSVFTAVIFIDDEEIKEYMHARQNEKTPVIAKLFEVGMKSLNVKSSKFDKD